MSNLVDRTLFLKSWLARPWEVAAVSPSSDALARLITSEIHPAGGPVVELGPGTGVFTERILARGVPARELVVIEKHPEFARRMRQRYPQADTHEIDVRQLRRLASRWNTLNAQAVVSGLPLLTMGLRTQFGVLGTCFQMLRPGGAFYQFTYLWRCPIAPEVLDRLGLTAQPVGKVWWNLPPASVYRIVRRA